MQLARDTLCNKLMLILYENQNVRLPWLHLPIPHNNTHLLHVGSCNPCTYSNKKYHWFEFTNITPIPSVIPIPKSHFSHQSSVTYIHIKFLIVDFACSDCGIICVSSMDEVKFGVSYSLRGKDPSLI